MNWTTDWPSKVTNNRFTETLTILFSFSLSDNGGLSHSAQSLPSEMTSGSFCLPYHTYIPSHSCRQVYMILKSSKQIFISYVYNTQLKDLWREIQRGEIARQSSLSRRSMFSFWRLKIGGGDFTEELKHVKNPKLTMRKKKKWLNFSHNENFYLKLN